MARLTTVQTTLADNSYIRILQQHERNKDSAFKFVVIVVDDLSHQQIIFRLIRPTGYLTQLEAQPL